MLIVAFDSAWQTVQDSGANLDSKDEIVATRALLALRIIEVAKSSGVRDSIQLRDDALLHLTQSNRKRTGL
jgi:hypothetical protein